MWLPRSAILALLVSSNSNDAFGANAKKQKPEVNLTVKMYNYAQVSGETLVHGEEVAAWIFHRAGIELRWVDCPTSAQDIPTFPECGRIKDPFARTVKILPRSMSERFDLPAAKFGFALRPNEAFVFFDRVLEVTKDTGFSRPRVLGHIMAHELGHLLLDGASHSATGLMSASVLARDCERPGVMVLLFTTSQGEQMRAQLQETLATK